jgi:chromosome partitioning protein
MHASLLLNGLEEGHLSLGGTMKVIAVVNQKGGCGKTTTAVNLAAVLGQHQERVLLIDLDPQGHASLGLGHPSADLPGLYEVLNGERALRDVVQRDAAVGVDLVPGTITLAAAEHLLSGLPDRAHRLYQQIAGVRDDYDYTILDCPPALGLLSINAIRAADQVLVPVDASLYALDGIERLRETLGLLEAEYGIRPQVRLLANMFDMRTRLAKEILEILGSQGSLELCKVRIRNTIRVREAAYHGSPLTKFARSAPVTKDFLQLAEEIAGPLREGAEEAEAVGRRHRDAPARRKPAQAESLREVVLSFQAENGARIEIAGDFNAWVPDDGVETQSGDGELRKILRLKPGSYEYRLIVDGVWQPDPKNPERVPNELGGINSLLRV